MRPLNYEKNIITLFYILCIHIITASEKNNTSEIIMLESSSSETMRLFDQYKDDLKVHWQNKVNAFEKRNPRLNRFKNFNYKDDTCSNASATSTNLVVFLGSMTSFIALLTAIHNETAYISFAVAGISALVTAGYCGLSLGIPCCINNHHDKKNKERTYNSNLRIKLMKQALKKIEQNA